MSRKKSDLGQSLYQSRFGKTRKNYNANKRTSMKSVLEESNIEKIFSMGELSGRDFSGIRIITNKDREGLLDQVAKKQFEQAKEEYESLLSIPRRPKIKDFTNKELLLQTEKENFLKWRVQLARIETDKRVKLTPYELNLDFWRQLWRVIERSDVLIQVVDARNPLLFRSSDLESYVKEVDSNKINIILINKADFLTEDQRKMWAKYFDKLHLRVIFWSAKYAEEKRKNDKKLAKERAMEENILGNEAQVSESEDSETEGDNKEDEELETDPEDESIEENSINKDDEVTPAVEKIDEEVEIDPEEKILEKPIDKDDESFITDDDQSNSDLESFEFGSDDSDSNIDDISSEIQETVENSWDIIGVDQIISLLEQIQIKTPYTPGRTTVGLVGYPNVGKSSTINAIFGRKKVSVSATPGHTKRFQTLLVTEKLTFCDCPGLVMPSIVHSKGHLMVSGILPIANIRDYIAPINIIAEQFPRQTIELMYGIKLPDPKEGEDPYRPPTAREVLSSYSYTHSMMTSKGNPNLDRAARIILKDYVDGKLLYRHPPPSVSEEDFKSAADLPEEKRFKAVPKSCSAKKLYTNINEPELPMDEYLKNGNNLPNYSCVRLLPIHEAIRKISLENTESSKQSSINKQSEKPWKKNNNKRCKHEKMRRKHKDLDNHAYVYD